MLRRPEGLGLDLGEQHLDALLQLRVPAARHLGGVDQLGGVIAERRVDFVDAALQGIDASALLVAAAAWFGARRARGVRIGGWDWPLILAVATGLAIFF